MSESTKLHDAACPEPQQLPAEVWAKIFRKMTIEDWARAAGTTQASWAANPYPHSTCFVSLTSACVPGLEGAHAALGFLTLLTVLRATGIQWCVVMPMNRQASTDARVRAFQIRLALKLNDVMATQASSPAACFGIPASRTTAQPSSSSQGAAERQFTRSLTTTGSSLRASGAQ